VTRRLALLLVAAAGCGKPPAPPPPPPVAVSGHVLDSAGKPFGRVMLAFNPADNTIQGQRPVVPVQVDGTFTANCPPGVYKPTLVPLPAGAGHGPEDLGLVGAKGGTVGKTIPEKYRTADRTPWEVRVTADGKNEFELKVAEAGPAKPR
jgi:hypothetical protein